LLDFASPTDVATLPNKCNCNVIAPTPGCNHHDAQLPARSKFSCPI
jgi:hypothetical protein